jgi:hypothetical protein
MSFGKRCLYVLLAVLVLAVALAAIGCATGPKDGTVRERVAATPALNLKNYKFDPASSVADRIGPAPKLVLDHLRTMDGRDDYAAYTPTDTEKQLALQYLDLLPAWFDAMLKDRLVGIYFVENLLGAGFTEFVLDGKDKVHAFIAVNPATLLTGLSEWMTAREASCFQPGSGADAPSVFVECSGSYKALLYALVHECGHVADHVYHFTPYVEPTIKELGLGVAATPFIENVWTDYAKPESRADFPLRTDVTFYKTGGGPKIPVASAAGMYRSLEGSPFPSLYAAQNWAEDFAECFTWYFFTDRLQQSYTIGVKRGAAVEVSYEPIYWSRVVHRFPQLDPVVQDVR